MNNLAYLFDLDGVLIDTEKKYSDFWNTIRDKYVVNQPDFSEVIKGNTLEFILEHYIQPANCDEVRKNFFLFENNLCYSLYPRAIETLKQIHEHGYKVAIVTSSDEIKMESLRNKIPYMFSNVDYVLSATEMRKSKPFPDCWWQAAGCLGVDIKDCIILEDSINGLKSAHASGGYVIGVATGLPREVVAQYSDKVINQIGELYE